MLDKDYPPGITHVITSSGCSACSGKEYYAVSSGQAEETIDALERRANHLCRAKWKARKLER